MDLYSNAQPSWMKGFCSNLAARGLDIMHPFQVQVFNQESPAENRLSEFGRPATLGVLIGNSCQLWPHFIAALASNSDQIQADNPLDHYVERVVQEAIDNLLTDESFTAIRRVNLDATPRAGTAPNNTHSCNCSQVWYSTDSQQKPEEGSKANGVAHDVRFSHSVGDKFVNMLRVAQLSGLAYYSSTTHLCMHPVYGPWFALRAVIVFDIPWPGRHGGLIAAGSSDMTHEQKGANEIQNRGEALLRSSRNASA